MRSIRLSLVLYFLLLLGLSLGSVSTLVYHTTRYIFLEKKKATHDLLQAQNADHCDNVQVKLDEDLLNRARDLAEVARYQRQWNRTGLQGGFPSGGWRWPLPPPPRT